MRNVVTQLAIMGPLTDDMDQAQMARALALIDQLPHPLTRCEIEALFALLPATGDLACGLNWTILHAIEASPEWPIWDLLPNRETHEWQDIFVIRLENAQKRQAGDNG